MKRVLLPQPERGLPSTLYKSLQRILHHSNSKIAGRELLAQGWGEGGKNFLLSGENPFTADEQGDGRRESGKKKELIIFGARGEVGERGIL